MYIQIHICSLMHVWLYTYIHKCLSAYMYVYIHMHTYRLMPVSPHMYMQMLHRVFSRTIKSLVCAVGADSSMTEPTINSTLYAFIEQVNFSDLQKMVLQFAICFVSTMVYTYMVYTLYNKTKHSVQSSNMHFTIN